MTIDEALRLLLIGTAGNTSGTKSALAALVGSSVFAIEAPQGQADPKIVYHEISSPGEYSHDGDTGLAHPRFQVECYGKTPAAAKTLAEAVRANVTAFAGIVSGIWIQATFIVDEASFSYASPGASENLERGYRLDLILWHQRA